MTRSRHREQHRDLLSNPKSVSKAAICNTAARKVVEGPNFVISRLSDLTAEVALRRGKTCSLALRVVADTKVDNCSNGIEVSQRKKSSSPTAEANSLNKKNRPQKPQNQKVRKVEVGCLNHGSCEAKIRREKRGLGSRRQYFEDRKPPTRNRPSADSIFT